MKSIQRISLGLAVAGALMVSVHSAGIWLYHCSSNAACLASVYFGLSEEPASLPEFSFNNTAESTLATIAPTGLSWGDIHQIVFIVGLYALLFGGTLTILFKIIESRHQNIFAKHKKIHT